MAKERNFTVEKSKDDKTTYRGFDRDFKAINLDLIVLVMIEGDVDVWALEDRQYLSNLHAYLTDHGAYQVLGVFKLD